MTSKYCSYTSLVEWFINPNKTHKNGSIGWKEMVLAFPLVVHWTTCRIGKVTKVIIGEDPWEGAGYKSILLVQVIQHLRTYRIIVLADAQFQ